MYCILVQFSHEADDPTNPVVYFHFEEDQDWTNHGAQFVMEETPFADAMACSHCTGPGTGTGQGPGPGPGTMALYIMLCTTHITQGSEQGQGQGQGTGTNWLHTHFTTGTGIGSCNGQYIFCYTLSRSLSL